MTNLLAYSGETFRRQFVLTDANGDPQDLSGATVEGQIRLWEGGTVLGKFSSTIEPHAGVINLLLSPSETRKLKTKGIYDVWLKTNNDRTLVSSGNFIVRPSATDFVDEHDDWGMGSWGGFSWPASNSTSSWGTFPWGGDNWR